MSHGLCIIEWPLHFEEINWEMRNWNEAIYKIIKKEKMKKERQYIREMVKLRYNSLDQVH